MTRNNESEGRAEGLASVSDDELFDLIREQVNKARNVANSYDRARTRAIAAEMHRRGWSRPVWSQDK
jgi:hypothetical protein